MRNLHAATTFRAPPDPPPPGFHAAGEDPTPRRHNRLSQSGRAPFARPRPVFPELFMPRHRTFRPTTALLAFAAFAAAITAQGTPIGFEETYALAPDRAKVVATLIPGSEDWYYYSCRERLDARDFASVRRILATWIDRSGHNQRTYEIENREALLSFADGAERTFDFLRSRLGRGGTTSASCPASDPTCRRGSTRHRSPPAR
jgi:hypothetical protein